MQNTSENTIVTSQNNTLGFAEGSRILKTNSFFQDLTKLMKNIDFYNFYKEHFTDWSNIQTTVFFMKLYTTIDYEYMNRYNEKISDEIMVFMLHKIMTTGSIRKNALKSFRNFQEDFCPNRTEHFRSLLYFDMS